MRLRKVLSERAAERNSEPRPEQSVVSPRQSWAREPLRDGRLLVWHEEFSAGGVQRGDCDDVASALRGAVAAFEDLSRRGLLPLRAIFFDVEACGLADLPVFLLGVLRLEERALRLVQLLAPDPSAEPELLKRGAEVLDGAPSWVTYNGRSFDAPRLRRRSALHRVAWPEPHAHLDLLHEVRRRWKHELPDCKLSTVESRLLGLERMPGDIPGREVPDRYYDFVRSGETRWLEPVIEHNRRDVAALAVLLLRVLEAGA
jgi:hypothetical protein